MFTTIRLRKSNAIFLISPSSLVTQFKLFETLGSSTEFAAYQEAETKTRNTSIPPNPTKGGLICRMKLKETTTMTIITIYRQRGEYLKEFYMLLVVLNPIIHEREYDQ